MSLESTSDSDPSSKVSQFSEPEVAVLTVDELEVWRSAGGGGACDRYGFMRGYPCWEELKDSDDNEELDECEKPVDR
jgi:hypothetical protein